MKNILRLALCSSLFATALTVSGSSVTQAAGPPSALDVSVVNTPLPVTGTVSVSNFPASSTVSGSVSITGTPDVAVTNSAANPVPTQNVGGGTATQVGQPAGKLVNLKCNFGSCIRILPDGSEGSAFSVPAGEALVITDVQWDFASPGSQGAYDFVVVRVNGRRVAQFYALVDAQRDVAGQAHLATGIVSAPGSTISLDGIGFVQGYLVPNL